MFLMEAKTAQIEMARMADDAAQRSTRAKEAADAARERLNALERRSYR